jgi:predicted ATPase/class 3 adenylate cyclase/DNA-binding CsgD family transcriptional regulator
MAGGCWRSGPGRGDLWWGGQVSGLPAGPVTFLFSDIEGSTRLVKALRERYPQVLAEHRRLVRAAIAAHDGAEVDTPGDAFFAAFGGATQAVLCALDIQRALAAHAWPGGAQVRVRIGVHTGQAVPAGGAYTGLAVHRAARICAAAGGGQVLVSQATQMLIEDEEEGEPGFTLVDVGEYRLKDLDRPVLLFQLAAAGLEATGLPAGGRGGPAGKPHGLTGARTSLIGRLDAVAKVARLLDGHRLVTVTGPGGVGKTRLAGEVLRQVASRFADGVAVVELAPVSEPALVTATVATALDVRQAAGTPLVDAVAGRLSRQQLLLVLDNCEHVLEAAAQLCEALLVAADDLTILATSREPLGLADEARYRLPPLTLPGADTPQAAEAVRLFLERARQVDPDFAVEGDESVLLAGLVRRLDGLPLAIELAAARVEALGLAQLAGRLEDRSGLLVSGNRAAAARQRSLEATVEWSCQLLTEAERQVFRRLAIFPGPFTLDAAEAVAGPEAGHAVLRLVDCSLLVPPVTGPDGRARYLMLQTLRGYGLNQLREAGEQHDAAAALAAYALGVAGRAAAAMVVGSGEKAAALWLDAEDAVVHQGLAWALEYDPPAALRLAVALAQWWMVRGRWIQAMGFLQRAVDQTGPDQDGWYPAHVWLGRLAGRITDSSAVSHFTTVVDALTGGPPSADLVQALVGRSSVLRNLGTTAGLEAATADANAALTLARQMGDATGEAMALVQFSVIATYTGDHERAVERATQAQRIDHSSMPEWCARVVESTLTSALVESGHLDGTPELLTEMLAHASAAGDPRDQAEAHFWLALVARQTGRLADAQAHLRQAAELAAHISGRMRLIETVEEAGYWCAANRQYDAAVTLWAVRDAQFRADGLTDMPAEERAREQPLREATQALDAQQLRAARERGTAMTLAAATEYAIMLTSEHARDPGTAPGPGKLSSRERELVALVARGQTDAQIAGQLFISVSTVRSHLDRIRDKTGCRRRADLTRLALQEGII